MSNLRGSLQGTSYSIYLWDAQTGEQLRSWSSEYLPTDAIQFSPDGRLLAFADNSSNKFIFWDVVHDVEFAELDQAAPNGLSFSPSGTQFATWSNNGTISLCAITKTGIGTCHVIYQIQHTPYAGMLFSKNGDRLAIGRLPNLTILDLNNSDNIESIANSGINGLLLYRDSGNLVGISTANGDQFYNIVTGRKLSIIPKFTVPIVNGDETIYAAWESSENSPSTILDLISVENGKLLSQIDLPPSYYAYYDVQVEFSSSSNYLMLAIGNGTIELWGILRTDK